MIGVFCALDFFLFYVFWEVMLVPMYFLIGVWGGPRKLYAAIKFFLYTLFGSVVMLLAIIALYFFNTTGFLLWKGLGNAPTFDIPHFHQIASQIPPDLQLWLFWRSSSGSRSRCRCSRSTRGCPTRTSRLPPPAR